jgi:hypothetical protein
MSWLTPLSALILGNPYDDGLQRPVQSYEEVHSDAQSILLPNTFPPGLTVHYLQAMSKHFALQHRCAQRPPILPSVCVQLCLPPGPASCSCPLPSLLLFLSPSLSRCPSPSSLSLSPCEAEWP